MKELIYKYKTADFITKIIYQQVILAFVLVILNFFVFPGNPSGIYKYLILSSESKDWMTVPSTFITYGFIYQSIYNLIFTLGAFYFSSKFFLNFFRLDSLLKFSVIGWVTSAVVFAVLSLFFESTESLHGGLPMIYSMVFGLFAYTSSLEVNLANFPIKIPLKYIIYFLIGLSVFSFLKDTSNLSSISYLSAGATGFLYMKFFEIGKDFLSFLPVNKFIELHKKF